MEYDSKLSDIIASLPEVAGGFLYAPEKGIYSNQTAGIANDLSLQQVSLKLTKIVTMISVHFQDTGAIRVYFKDLVLFGTMIEGGHWLFLLHQPSLSPGMIKMTVQMALNIATEEPPQTEIADLSQKTNTQDQTKEDIITILLADESELRDPLTNIQSQLAQYIGPVAELVLHDSVEVWASQHSPSLENFPKLIDMVGREIDDEDDRNAFLDSFTIREKE